MLFSATTGYVLLWTNSNYVPVFIVCGSVYLLALLIMHLLVPRLEPAKIDVEAAT